MTNRKEGRLNMKVQQTHFHENGYYKRGKRDEIHPEMGTEPKLYFLSRQPRRLGWKDRLCNLNISSVLSTKITNFEPSVLQAKSKRLWMEMR